MSELLKYVNDMLADDIIKAVISKPVNKNGEFKKLTVQKISKGYQISKYTEKQVFHENVDATKLCNRLYELTTEQFLQVNGWSAGYEHIIMISKKGACTYKRRSLKANDNVNNVSGAHNRKKNYIIEEGQDVPPLVDMGIFTTEGRVVASMYDKFKQINRFIEIIDDSVKELKGDTINVIDFGCGKSYLTFVLYYYLTKVRGLKANIIGLDLKADVIKKCNEAAEKYGYTGLKFELGDINGYKTPFDIDMVITLHACDTATDYALYNAIKWNAKMIFSVPCCQHELNSQIKAKELGILTRYGIIKERFSALATDSIRGELLEIVGYKTQLLEFIDLAHTPKNILIRAVKKPIVPVNVKKKLLSEIEMLNKEFGFEQTLYRLLKNDGYLNF